MFCCLVFGTSTDIPEVISLFLEPEILDEWIGLEKDAISIAIDEILTDPNAFENRFEIMNDIDAVIFREQKDYLFVFSLWYPISLTLLLF